MPLPVLDDPDVLHVVVFGHGSGEAVVVHAPPDQWLLVDSVAQGPVRSQINPVVDLLAAHTARWTGLVLTHAHQDHAKGFGAYLEAGRGAGPVGCALPPHVNGARTTNLSGELGATKLAQKVERTIDARWDDDPEAVWSFAASLETKRFGDLEVRPLWPGFPVKSPVKLNEASTPLELCWGSATVLLGADLPDRQWEDVAQGGFDGTASNPVKAAHHGSKDFQHVSVTGAGHADRLAVIAPLTGSALPDFRDGHGVQILLSRFGRVVVTAFPWADIAGSPGRQDALSLQQGSGQAQSGYSSLERPRIDPRDAWVHVVVSRDGEVCWTLGPAARELRP